MLLTSFVLLGAFGTGMWLIGHHFEFHGVAAIGATIIILTGGAAAISDVAVQSGEDIERDYTTVANQPVENHTSIAYDTDPVATSNSIGSAESYLLGALTMIAGGLLLSQDLNQIGG